VQGISAADIHTARDSANPQNLILLLQQDYFSASFASACGGGDTRTSRSDHNYHCHVAFLLYKGY
jgi:hypothetical protein